MVAVGLEVQGVYQSLQGLVPAVPQQATQAPSGARRGQLAAGAVLPGHKVQVAMHTSLSLSLC